MKPPKRMSAADVLLVAKANGFNYLKATDCPDLETRHAKGFPKDFNPSTGRSKSHRQERCPTCGFWSLWTARIDGSAKVTWGIDKHGDPQAEAYVPLNHPPHSDGNADA